jgi:hypothetical protein
LEASAFLAFFWKTYLLPLTVPVVSSVYGPEPSGVVARLALLAAAVLPTIMPMVPERFFSKPGCGWANLTATFVGLTTVTEVISCAPPFATAE